MRHSVFKYLGYCLLFFLLQSCNNNETEEVTPEHPFNNNKNNQTVGASANDLLSAENYDQLVIEILYVEGFKPTTKAVENLEAFLEARLNKPGGITFQQKAIASPGKSSYSISDIRSIEESNRTAYTEENSIAAYFFFADGSYAQDTENSKVLGVAYKNTSMVIFQKTIQSLSGDIFEPDRALLESTVINHEFAHIMGLVNVGTSLQSDHQDEAHGHHCDVESCLMNYVAETGDVVTNLVNADKVPTLDSQCISDLQANGGK